MVCFEKNQQYLILFVVFGSNYLTFLLNYLKYLALQPNRIDTKDSTFNSVNKFDSHNFFGPKSNCKKPNLP